MSWIYYTSIKFYDWLWQVKAITSEVYEVWSWHVKSEVTNTKFTVFKYTYGIKLYILLYLYA